MGLAFTLEAVAPQKYPYPPITEAIAEFRTANAATPTLKTLRQVADEFSDELPNVEAAGEASGVFSVDAAGEASASASAKQTGYTCRSHDGKLIGIVMQGSFAVSRLAPYGGWGDFSATAKNLWETYDRIVKPAGVVRVGLRYINKIDIPLADRNLRLNDYFCVRPSLPKDLSTQTSSFFLRVELPQEDFEGGMAIVNFAPTVQPDPNTGAFILDIDVSSSLKSAANSSEAWAIACELRNRKNKIFEACVTEDAKRLFTKDDRTTTN